MSPSCGKISCGRTNSMALAMRNRTYASTVGTLRVKKREPGRSDPGRPAAAMSHPNYGTGDSECLKNRDICCRNAPCDTTTSPCLPDNQKNRKNPQNRRIEVFPFFLFPKGD